MPLNINGGTDHAWWTIAENQPSIGVIAFWIRTVQATLNTTPLTFWSATSRLGWGIIGNNPTAGKIGFAGYDTTTQRIGLSSTTLINDGNPHHIAVRYGRSSGNGCQLYIDGTQEATANASAAWGSTAANYFLQAGDQLDAFWASFIGDIWDIGFWNVNPVLTDDEIMALAKGFPPRLIRRPSLIFHAPLLRDTRDIRNAYVLNALVGTSFGNPPGRQIGGSM